MAQVIDLTNKRFERLLVLERSESRYGMAFWKCQCDCGTIKIICGQSLRDGRILSCGCLGQERTRARSTRHGHAQRNNKSPAYRCWRNMLTRCYRQEDRVYPSYGGRGIIVCEQWRTSFEGFYSDMGDPMPGMTLDRIDNDGNYTPENCRWATRSEQSENRRPTIRITYHGTTQSIAAWERQLGFARNLLMYRIKQGWDTERAFTTPVQHHKKHA